MPVVERPMGVDVLTAARRRVADSLISADSFLVMFSGGKDSQTVLHLVRDWAEAEGRLPIDVVFLDEEMLPDGVISTVEHYARMDWIRMHWFVVPMNNAKVTLGRSEAIVTWDPDRERHVREPPDNPWVIRPESGDAEVRSQQSMDGYVYERTGMRGAAMFVTGIRADESLHRRQGIKQQRSRPWVATSSDGRVELSRPIYDWRMSDVFLYLREVAKVEPCAEYQRQALSGMRMRISTPLHGEAIRQLDRVRAVDPDFLQRLFDAYGDVELHERYSGQIDRPTMNSYAGCTMADCARFIQAMPPGIKRDQAVVLFRNFSTYNNTAPEAMPPEHLMYHLAKGTTQRSRLQPLKKEEQERLMRAREKARVEGGGE